MSEEVNRKIAKWLDWENLAKPEYNKWLNDDFIPSDVDAITLLPVLVERGYVFRLEYYLKLGYEFSIWDDPDDITLVSARGSAIAESITTAVLALIEREVAK